MSAAPSKPTAESPDPFGAEVRYRLPNLLADLNAERSAGLFAQERFSQGEIEKIFKARKFRHGKRLK
jgi:hypothetical protein